MLIGGILAAVVVGGLIAAAVLRRRSQDDEHSVEHYHRQLHTLEEIRSHPIAGTGEGSDENGHDEAAFPATAFRVSGSSTVRLTEPGHTIVPPVPPPPVANPSEPIRFDDGSAADPSKAKFVIGQDDRAMHSIDHRPRRLGGPIAAVSAVLVLIVILIVTGLHSTTPSKHPKSSGTATTVTTVPARSHPRTGGSSHTNRSTTTTTPPAVSAPTATSLNGATYQVADASFSLALSAKAGECWISATDTNSGNVLFTGVLASGQSHTVSATGPVTVVAGAPEAFAATVNGVTVQLPFGFQAPFTLKFETPGGTGTTTPTTASNSGQTG